jgi:threonine dehydrogenase-like Zn-dependent dehydrogenase
LRALSRRLLDVEPLITGTYGFERAGEAFEKAVEKDSVKILLDFRG